MENRWIQMCVIRYMQLFSHNNNNLQFNGPVLFIQWWDNAFHVYLSNAENLYIHFFFLSYVRSDKHFICIWCIPAELSNAMSVAFPLTMLTKTTSVKSVKMMKRKQFSFFFFRQGLNGHFHIQYNFVPIWKPISLTIFFKLFCIRVDPYG